LLSGVLLTSGNGRKDAHFITWFHGRLGVLKKPDFFLIHEYVYEPANVILLIANAFVQTRVTLFQIVDYIPDRRTFDPNNFLVLGVTIGTTITATGSKKPALPILVFYCHKMSVAFSQLPSRTL
jgi:hypothetical protein